MASPQIEVFFLYNLTTGAPLTGLTPTFETYKTDLGVNVTPQPVITEVGGGAYKFTPVFADTARGIAYVIDAGATANPRRVARYMRPEDWTTDTLASFQDLHDALLGKWEIKTAGPDINHLIFYKADGSTVLKKFLLTDAGGVPTTINPYKRSPV